MSKTKWLFQYHMYSQFRPKYSDQLIQNVFEFLAQRLPRSEWKIAADVGCGTGQGTGLLAKHFGRVYGIDISEEQIATANEKNSIDNVLYMTGTSDNIPLETNSVQLLTAFKSAQFFDRQKFFKESDRLLVRNGVVAFIAYNKPEPIDPSQPDDQRLNAWLETAYADPRIQPFKSSVIVSLEKRYRDITFPDNYESVYSDHIFSYTARADSLIGYIQSWGFFQRMAETDGQTAEEYLREYEQKLKTILNLRDLSSKEITMKVKYFIAMANKLN